MFTARGPSGGLDTGLVLLGGDIHDIMDDAYTVFLTFTLLCSHIELVDLNRLLLNDSS